MLFAHAQESYNFNFVNCYEGLCFMTSCWDVYLASYAYVKIFNTSIL